MNKKTALIGILGGTFDPIHYGHLRLALILLQQFPLQEIRFIPCKQPLLKQHANASAAQRIEMLKIAIQDQLGFVLDDREIYRTTPSYTIDTLLSLKTEVGANPLCLIIGSDILSDFTRWHRWEEIPQLAHLIIVQRHGFQLPQQGKIADMLAQRLTEDKNQLIAQPHGCILIEKIPLLEISSREIRVNIRDGLMPRYLLPDNVLYYIQEQKLYRL